jgi:MFS family permease
VKVLVSRTFHSSQGTAMGFALLGTSVGSVVVPLIISSLIAGFGWRIGMAAMSFGIWLIAIPMLFLGFFNRSMASPDAFARGVKATPEQISQRKLDRQGARTASSAALRLMMKNRSFWLIGGAVFSVAIVDQAFIQHQVLIFDDLRVPRDVAALAISAIGLVGIGFRVIVGNILDGTSHKGAAALYMFLTLSSLLAFLLGNPIVLMAYVVMRAAGHAAVLLDTTVLTKHAFGLKNYGTLIGLYTAVVSLGYAMGPWLMGRLYDTEGSYRIAFIVFAAIPVLAAVLIWFMKPDYWTPPKSKSVARSDHGVA